jgi:hypothetical protein
MRAENLYKGRKPKASRQSGGDTLRQPSKQPGGERPPSTKGHFGDVGDNWLRGKGSPYSQAHDVKKK